jgi:hypothetical protein
VRGAVIRLRQSAILNDDLATVIAEIEALDALLPSLDDVSDFRSDLPQLTWSSPCAEPFGKPSTPRTLAPGLANDWPGVFADSELSNTVDPRDTVRCANFTPTACDEHSSLTPTACDEHSSLTPTACDEHSSLTALNRANEVQMVDQANSIRYPKFDDASLNREVTAQTRRHDWISTSDQDYPSRTNKTPTNIHESRSWRGDEAQDRVQEKAEEDAEEDAEEEAEEDAEPQANEEADGGADEEADREADREVYEETDKEVQEPREEAEAEEPEYMEKQRAKRKLVDAFQENSAPATKRQQCRTGKTLSMADISSLPTGMATPDELYVIYKRKTEKRYHDDLEILVRIFYATGSPTIIDQLAPVCRAANQGDITSTNVDSEMSQMIRKLDQIELADPIIRRHCLVQLLDRRTELEEECRAENEVQKSSRSVRMVKYDLRRLQSSSTILNMNILPQQLEKPDSNAVIKLMAECYPHLRQPTKDQPQSTDIDYIEYKKRLQNRLRSARNWRTLKNAFGIGILLLVPCDIQTNR